MNDPETAFVLVTDQSYYAKAKITIEDLRLCGKWTGAIVLVCAEFEPVDDFIQIYNVTCHHVKHIDVTCLTKIWKTNPIKSMEDNRHVSKLSQYNKLYVFNSWFRTRWNRIIYVDAGLRIIDTVSHLLSLPWQNRFLAPDDTQPGDNGHRLSSQFDMVANPDITKQLYSDFSESFFSEKYFMNCVWIYDTILQDSVSFETLIGAIETYPICLTNEMALMNLYFKKYWTPFPEKTADAGKYLYGWCELNYPTHERSWKNFCMLKYPVTLPPNPLSEKNTIGVVIPCYLHHVEKLGSLLESIEKQTCKPDQVVVSCSSVSDDVHIPYNATMYSFPLQIIRHVGRKNAAENRNIATKYIRTSTITYFDADDMMHPQRLECIQDVFQKTDAKIILHNFINGSGNFQTYDIQSLKYNYGKLRRAPSGCAYHIENLDFKIHHSQSSIRSTVFDMVQFNESTDHERREDAVFCGDVLAHYPTQNAYIHEELSKYFMEGVWY